MIGEFGETVVLDWGLTKVQGQDEQQSPDKDVKPAANPNVTVDGHALSTPAFPYPGSSQRWAQQKIDKLSKEVGEPQAAPAPATSSPP